MMPMMLAWQPADQHEGAFSGWVCTFGCGTGPMAREALLGGANSETRSRCGDGHGRGPRARAQEVDDVKGRRSTGTRRDAARRQERRTGAGKERSDPIRKQAR